MNQFDLFLTFLTLEPFDFQHFSKPHRPFSKFHLCSVSDRIQIHIYIYIYINININIYFKREREREREREKERVKKSTGRGVFEGTLLGNLICEECFPSENVSIKKYNSRLRSVIVSELGDFQKYLHVVLRIFDFLSPSIYPESITNAKGVEFGIKSI